MIFGYSLEEWAAIIAYEGYCPITLRGALDFRKKWHSKGLDSINIFLADMPKEWEAAYRIAELAINDGWS